MWLALVVEGCLYPALLTPLCDPPGLPHGLRLLHDLLWAGKVRPSSEDRESRPSQDREEGHCGLNLQRTGRGLGGSIFYILHFLHFSGLQSPIRIFQVV